ncbi:MAG: replication initiation factor domain-containing protein [Brachymonas sp.]|nr:replication initiation factor domain-containing protein [Brachymonas sp.]
MGKRSAPPTLIGGKSFTNVDWLTFTFLPDREKDIAAEMLAFLRRYLAPEVQAITCPGLLGYENGVRFFLDIDGQACHVARMDWGGNHYMGRARMDISGTGCSRITRWADVRQHIATQCFDLNLTRVDLAVDFLNGEYTVEQAKDWYEAGEFNAGGRMPKHSVMGAWFGNELEPGEGRTLNIGKRGNGKMLRVYEKGRQLGDPESKWTRFEVEFRNIKRDLPLDLLTECDAYFAGAYKALANMLDTGVAAEKVATHQKEGEISLSHLVDYARTSYGKTIHVMRLTMTDTEIIESLAINGVPARLEKAAVAGVLSVSPLPDQRRTHHETDRPRF